MSDVATHICPGGCGRQVPRHLLACQPCWFRLPADLRNAVNGTFRSRMRTRGRPTAHSAAVTAHREALAAALRWYRSKPPAVSHDG